MDKMIYNQRAIPKETWRYGFRSSAATGCGWIATYNALWLLRKPESPEALIRAFGRQFPLVNGNLGTFLFSPARLLRKRGFTVKACFRPSKFDTLAKQADACILFYRWVNTQKIQAGAHFVALRHTDRGFVGYNTYRSSTGPDFYGTSLSGFLARRKYFLPVLFTIHKKKSEVTPMTDVVAIGELLIDFTCKSVDAEGYPTMEAHPGGAPANFLAALTKFGCKTAFLGKVGTDAFGKMLTQTLAGCGIETKGLLADDNVFTTIAFVTLDESGDREFSFSRKPGADTCIRFEELDLSLIDESKVFHFGTLSLTDEPARSATYQAVAYAKNAGKLITYDPNLRKPLWRSEEAAKEQMLWGLAQADVVKISDEEVQFLFGLGVEEGGKYILDNYGCKLVFVTCGADGCFFINKNCSGMVPSLQGIQVVDTTGAGDIFGGSAVYMLLQSGKAPEELDEEALRRIVRFACTAAGLSTTKPGGISSVPAYETVLENM